MNKKKEMKMNEDARGKKDALENKINGKCLIFGRLLKVYENVALILLLLLFFLLLSFIHLRFVEKNKWMQAKNTKYKKCFKLIPEKCLMSSSLHRDGNMHKYTHTQLLLVNDINENVNIDHEKLRRNETMADKRFCSWEINMGKSICLMQ